MSLFFAVVFFFLSLVRPLVVQFLQDVYGVESFHVGVLGSVGFLGSALFSIGVGKMGDRFGKMVAAAIALLVGGFSFVLFTWVNNSAVLALASFFNGASYMLWPLMGASVGSVTPEASRGRWISISQMSATIAASIAPYIGGLIYESSPYLPFYLITAVSPILALVAFTKPLKEQPRPLRIENRQ